MNKYEDRGRALSLAWGHLIDARRNLERADEFEIRDRMLRALSDIADLCQSVGIEFPRYPDSNV